MPEGAEELQKKMDKTKKELDKLKGAILKKYDFVQAIGILPPQAVKIFADDELGEDMPEEDFKKLQKKIHLYVIVPEEKFKEIPKIKKDIIEISEKAKQDVWVYLKTPVDIWESCKDSKFDMVNFIGMSYPLHDTGILSGLRVAEIHKNLVVQKFDKYVVSYVIAGSLVRGNATKTSDVDAFVIINDTDVKRMSRLELKERLRGMIYKNIAEATALAGVDKNILNVQIYLLTDFWESVKDANPVMFTFIRDGVPLYDKGTFLPWKALLNMGRLKPSPEAIDMFMGTAEKTGKMVERRLIDAMIDLYYKVLNPSQALIMLNGSPPPTHKETPSLMEKMFVTKEKLLKKSEVAVLARLVTLFRDYEHDPKMVVKGAEIDKLIKDSDIYLKRLQDLRKQIEKRAHERTVEQVYNEIFDLLGAIIKKKGQANLIAGFDELVKQGKFIQKHSRILNEIVKIKTEVKKGKIKSHKVDEARKNANILINELMDYSQRAEIMGLEKSRMRIRYKVKDKNLLAEVLHTNDASFLFVGNEVKKITNKIEASSMEEVTKHVEAQKSAKALSVDPKVFEFVRKELGDFDIVL
jgi:predicted nucleotidyltransferase/uncharacterized protein (UPF0332 family)